MIRVSPAESAGSMSGAVAVAGYRASCINVGQSGSVRKMPGDAVVALAPNE
jgi:hypothetical protein